MEYILYQLQSMAAAAAMAANTSNIYITTNILIILILILLFLCFLSMKKRIWLFRRESDHCLRVATGTETTAAMYCTVCLNEMNKGEKYRLLPNCHHCFHVDCIDVWFRSKSTCPLCRRNVSQLITSRQNQKRGFSFNFVSSSQDFFLRKICNPLNSELTLLMTENLQGMR